MDNLMMRVIEILSGNSPCARHLFVILLMTVMKAGIGSMIIAYIIVGWMGMARLVRGQIMSLGAGVYRCCKGNGSFRRQSCAPSTLCPIFSVL